MVLTLLATSLLSSAPAACRDAYDRMDLRGAVALCSGAISSAPAPQLGELYRLLGLAYGALGDEAHAQAAFASLLALDPHAELSAAISPKLRALFDRAKSGGARPVALTGRALGPVRLEEPVELEALIEDGPGHPVARVAARASESEVTALRGPVATRLTLAPPTLPGTLEIQLRAIDPFGGALASTLLRLEVSERASSRSWPLSWKVWTASAAGLAGAGLVLGLYSRSQAQAAQLSPIAVDAEQRLDRGRAAAYGANAAFAGAGALTVGALILFLTRPT